MKKIMSWTDYQTVQSEIVTLTAIRNETLARGEASKKVILIMTCQRLSENSDISRTFFLNWDFGTAGNLSSNDFSIFPMLCGHD